MRKILIASPVKDAFPVYHTQVLIALFQTRLPDCSFGFMYCASGGIHFARDQMAEYAIKHGFDELISWDIDLKPTVEQFHRLISHAEPEIVCGFYSKKDKFTHFNVQRILGVEPDDSGLVRVDRCAIGFSKVKVSAFHKIKAATPERAYNLCNEGESVATPYHQFYPSELVKTGEPLPLYFGEDYGFCRLATQVGIPLYVDTALLIPHSGPCDYPIPTEDLVKMLAEPWRNYQPAQPAEKPFSIVKPGEPLWPADYYGPRLFEDHCRDVLEGAYDLPFDPPQPPVILDIGANVGAFARWASKRWPGAHIRCYEPHPDNFALLARTIKTYLQGGDDSVSRSNLAVSDTTGEIQLYSVGYNCGEYTTALSDNLKSTCLSIHVPAIDAAALPSADLLKIDAEGSEFLVLERLAIKGRLAAIKAIVLEFHSAQHRTAITALLKTQGFTLHSESIHSEHRGVLKFLRK